MSHGIDGKKAFEQAKRKDKDKVKIKKIQG